MSLENRKAVSGACNTRDGNELSSPSSPTSMHTREPENNPRTFREANEQYAALRDRLRTTPRCPVCGDPIDLPHDTQLVRCDECGRKALADVYREWGALIDRVIGAVYSLGAWSDAEITIRSGDRVVARIDIPEFRRVVHTDPRCPWCASLPLFLLREHKLVVPEIHEVAFHDFIPVLFDVFSRHLVEVTGNIFGGHVHHTAIVGVIDEVRGDQPSFFGEVRVHHPPNPLPAVHLLDVNAGAWFVRLLAQLVDGNVECIGQLTPPSIVGRPSPLPPRYCLVRDPNTVPQLSQRDTFFLSYFLNPVTHSV